MWKGIEVRGNTNYSSLSSRQAVLTIEPGAIIEHAHNAVLAGKWESNYYSPCNYPQPSTFGMMQPYDLSGSGGIVHSDGAIFRNNAVDIRFAFYRTTIASHIINSNTGNSAGFKGGALRDPRYKISGQTMFNPFYASPNILGRASI